jgi:hypothetical protein
MKLGTVAEPHNVMKHAIIRVLLMKCLQDRNTKDVFKFEMNMTLSTLNKAKALASDEGKIIQSK